MPKKKKGSNSKILVAVLIIALVACAVVIYHDGLVGVTPIDDINDFDIDDGTAVTVKGRITNIETITNWVIINDGSGSIGFEWGFADDLEENTVVVVRGVVKTTLIVIRYISDVTSVQPIWLFA
ncbi:hypothetical protein EU527_04820 [Candidatus Thorarchaeota archaeon]|nr:MAG: hypothetical protein EU527_04820 [Candidatus Thorarchaeota archaeon]